MIKTLLKIKQFKPLKFLKYQNFISFVQPYSTFVSKHFQLGNNEVVEFLEKNKLYHRNSGEEIVIKECPFCHDTKGKLENFWKLYIHKISGAFMCHRCGNSGSWFDFKFKFSNADEKIIKLVNKEDDKTPIQSYQMQSYIVEFLNKRGISASTAQKYQIGSKQEVSFEGKIEKCITFPMYKYTNDNKPKLIRNKIRSITNKSFQKLEPKGGQWGLFGLNLVSPNSKEIILTEGEFDAMAIHEQTKLPACSIPNGCRSLPIQVLQMLEKFEKIYLWMDNDLPGQEGVEIFTKKLGISRCFICKSDAKDANEALLKKMNINQILKEAKQMSHNQILNYSSFKDQVKNSLFSKELSGTPSKLFPNLNRIIKGHRAGELSLITGPTGIGKTTILSQMSLDYVQQGIPTLWGSFEIKNTNLVKSMLCQMAQKDLSKYPTIEFEKVSEIFEKFPLYFMDFYGSTNIDDVIDTMEYSSYVYDVQHVVIDNLNFMLSGQGRGFDKFENQDKAIEKLRNFATKKNVHVSLVVHPRKTSEEEEIGISSIFGTAKATQEADNVLVIQNGRKYRSLAIKKNRFDGALGSVPYKFEKESRRILELTNEEIENVESGNLTLNYN
eukprot:gene3074-5244_t